MHAGKEDVLGFVLQVECIVYSSWGINSACEIFADK